MTGFSSDADRKVIPRWRTFRATLGLGELDTVDVALKHQEVATDFLASKIVSWHKKQTTAYAADVVGAAVVLGRESEVADAANFLLQNNLDTWPWGRELASRVLNSNQERDSTPPLPRETRKAELHLLVRTLRQLLGVEPRDPITWVDLSRAYAALGLRAQAGRCMSVALQLARDSRFVLRSGSRLWVYLDDPGKAHNIITRARKTRYDPWLLAAEIATAGAAGRTPRFTKASRRMLGSVQLGARHLSELASALGTLELSAGNIKRARRLFAKSLETPTENSIAQAAWASRHHDAVQFDECHLQRPNTFEARSWTYYGQSHWDDVVKQCSFWQFDQPFSSRPGIHGSYVAAIAREDYLTSKEFALRGLDANPTNTILLNNLAFALINLGDIDGAKDALSKINQSQISKESQTALTATRGLLKFRTGCAVQGRQLYAEAIRDAGRLQDRRPLVLATALYALEELSHATDKKNLAVSEALSALGKTQDPSLALIRSRLEQARREAQ